MFEVPYLKKIRKAMLDYLNQRASDPKLVAYNWSELPYQQQEQLFEVCLAFIQEVAEDNTPDHLLPALFPYYRDIARKMVKHK